MSTLLGGGVKTAVFPHFRGNLWSTSTISHPKILDSAKCWPLCDFLPRPDQGNFLFLIPARIDFCWPQEIKTQYKTHRIGFLERSLAKTQAWGPRIMSRLAWTTKITALCEVSSCVNSSVFVFLAPARIISIFWDEKQEISLVWPYHIHTNCKPIGYYKRASINLVLGNNFWRAYLIN